MRWSSRAVYLVALAIGLVTASRMFPLGLVMGALPAPDGVFTDFLQHATGQIGFFRQGWHWPLLVVDRLDAPAGTNIALTDSIPLEALLLKLEHSMRPLWPSVLPDWRQGISLYQAFWWVMQPLCAVFALRSGGERRWIPAIAVSVLALSMPTFLARMWHTALDSHYLILLAIGLYARATRVADPGVAGPVAIGPRTPFVLGSFAVLCTLTLLIHPYLMVMVSALLLAVPLSLALRRDRRWPDGMLAVAAASSGILGLGFVLGYWGRNGGAGGFGLLSMNLASPFWPDRSTLFPMIHGSVADGTGFQYFEGYQYLGAGLIGLLLVVLAVPGSRRIVGRLIRSHSGLLIVLAGLTIYAVSNRIWLFRWQILDVGFDYPGGSALRASGRLFWDVAYVVLIGTVIAASRGLGRAAPVLMLLAAFVQYVDTRTLRIDDRTGQLRMLTPAGPVTRRIETILPHYDKVDFFPRLECEGDLQGLDVPVVYLATQRGMMTDSMYLARQTASTKCGSALFRADQLSAPGSPSGPATLRVAAGDAAPSNAARMQAAGLTCGTLGPYVFCSQGGAGLEGLPAPVLQPIRTGVALTTATSGSGRRFLSDGWSGPEFWGVWSDGPSARLVLPVAAGFGAASLTLSMHAADFADRGPVGVTVVDQGRVLARWEVGRDLANYTVALPGTDQAPRVTVLELQIARTMRVPRDPRNLGLALISLRVDPRN